MTGYAEIVSTGRDDDALSWDGDDDPTLHAGEDRNPRPESAAEVSANTPPDPALPSGFTAVGKGSEDVGRIEADGTVIAPGEPQPLGNTALIALGILGGVYALFTVGWVIGGLRLQDVAVFLVSPIAYVPAFWLAVLAPAIWFVTTYALTRHAATWVRFCWLAAGAVLLVPWPFIMIGAVGQ